MRNGIVSMTVDVLIQNFLVYLKITKIINMFIIYFMKNIMNNYLYALIIYN